MYVVGTAGHVDHGKSTLVEALTGIDPDRLREEKEREMTIDLGFAWMKAGPGQEEIGFIDVPGHRDFIENMLAGVAGIDLALLVVAADEGVMPQTREHLAILDLLEVKSGVVAITKADLAEDDEWLELVALDLEEVLAGTALEGAPIIPVAARTGAGLEDLRQTILARLAATEPRPDLGRPRLPVDRVFTLSGFGTVVTGTLVGGSLAVGGAVEIMPAGLTARIRGLQTHRTKIQVARPGSRVAVNLSSVDREQIARGDVLATPGTLKPTVLCDVRYRHLPGAGSPLRHNSEVKLFVGSAEVLAKARVLGARLIEPGQTGWLQLALSRPAAIARGDRFILRRPSPGESLGGGVIVDPHPRRRHRRFRPEVVQRLETLIDGTPEDVLLEALSRREPVQSGPLLAATTLDAEEAVEAWTRLVEAGTVVLAGPFALTAGRLAQLLGRITAELNDFHAQYPLRPGLARAELRGRLRLEAGPFAEILQLAIERGLIRQLGPLIALAEHEIRFTPAQQRQVDQLLAQFETAGINSPAAREARAVIGDELYFALIEQGILVPVGSEVVYERGFYQALRATIIARLTEKGAINAAELRDLLGTSRKYAIAILEHLDEAKVTRREGDNRVLMATNEVQRV